VVLRPFAVAFGEVGSPRAAKAVSKPTVDFPSLIRGVCGLRERWIARTRSLPALGPLSAGTLSKTNTLANAATERPRYLKLRKVGLATCRAVGLAKAEARYAPNLSRIQLDDELLVHDRGNLIARRNASDLTLELILIDH
jgi:hypothetical protein